jgi:hypothetical protein
MVAMNSLHTAISTMIAQATFGRQEDHLQSDHGVDSIAAAKAADLIGHALPQRFDGGAELLHAAVFNLIGPATFRCPLEPPKQ